MTVKKIVEQYLIEHEFEGLCNGNNECGCGIDDLFPCGLDGTHNCKAALKTVCDGCDEFGDYCYTTDPSRSCWNTDKQEVPE